MKQNQRFILFLILSMGIFIGWINFGPGLFPGLFLGKKPAPVAKAKNEKQAAKKKGGKKSLKKKQQVVGKTPDPVKAPKPGDSQKKTTKKQTPKLVAKKQIPEPVKPKLVVHPQQDVKLGSLDPTTGIFLQVAIQSKGAAVESIKLNDKRYQTLERDGQLKIVGGTTEQFRTFETRIKSIDDLLKPFGKSLRTVHWKVEGKPQVVDGVTTSVTFSYTSPDGKLKLSKRFWLEKVDLTDRKLRDVQDTESKGYELNFALTIQNLDTKAQEVTYTLQGPVGVPLENPKIARVHRGIVTGFLQEDGTIKSSALTAADVVEDAPKWEGSISYIGIDVQYFVAMIMPGRDQDKSSFVKSSKPTVIDKAADIKQSDISLELTSAVLTLTPNGDKDSSITHTYKLYVGPKRKALLEPYEASSIIKYGWFGWIAQGMLWLLNALHGIGLPYGLAVIGLTILVRLGMFPLSKKQAKSANKMKELSPRIAELKKKYANDKEKLARAQMELFSKHGYNPLAGCLPIILQLPIFIGLYQALSNAVDLRLAPFHLLPWIGWIDNLAAPDAMFDLGFAVPFLGWTTFNLLPLITTVLFIVQQKLFMPPAMDDQAKMQQKMMMYMSVFFGFIFYTVPSGLCIYFIASSLWGIGERKLLDHRSKSSGSSQSADPPEPDKGLKGKTPDGAPEKPKGFFAKIMAMADDAAQAKARANGDGQSEKPKQGASTNGRGGNRKRKNRKKRGSRR